MAALTDESLNKLSKTDLVALAVNLQDKIETMKSNLNEKVRNLTEEVQKLNTNFELLKSEFSTTRIENNSLNERLIALERQCWANAHYSRRECLEITDIPSSVSDKDLEEVVRKAIAKAGVDINSDDIEDCHRVGNKGQTIIKFGKRKVSRQVLSVRKDLNKVKMSDIDLTEQSTLYVNQSLCPYYRMLWSKTYGELWTRITPNTDTFYAVIIFYYIRLL